MTRRVTQAEAFIDGWNSCMAGEDGRFTNPCERHTDLKYAWDHGFLTAMEAEDGETPEPACHGY